MCKKRHLLAALAFACLVATPPLGYLDYRRRRPCHR